MAAEWRWLWLTVSWTAAGVGVTVCCGFVCIRGMAGRGIKILRGIMQAFRAGLAGDMGGFGHVCLYCT